MIEWIGPPPLVQHVQQELPVLPLKDKFIDSLASIRGAACTLKRNKILNKETYRVSSSRSSVTSSVLTNSSSSSELIAKARRAFKGINSVDWKRLEERIIKL